KSTVCFPQLPLPYAKASVLQLHGGPALQDWGWRACGSHQATADLRRFFSERDLLQAPAGKRCEKAARPFPQWSPQKPFRIGARTAPREEKSAGGQSLPELRQESPGRRLPSDATQPAWRECRPARATTSWRARLSDRASRPTKHSWEVSSENQS